MNFPFVNSKYMYIILVGLWLRLCFFIIYRHGINLQLKIIKILFTVAFENKAQDSQRSE